MPVRLPGEERFLSERKLDPGPDKVPYEDAITIQQMVVEEAYKKQPSMLADFLVYEMNHPKTRAMNSAERLLAGETVDLPGAYGGKEPYDGIDEILQEHFSHPDALTKADRETMVDLARRSWMDQGYDGIVYTNTHPPELKGATDATTYLVFDPKNIRSRWAAFDPAKRHLSDIGAGIAVTAGAGTLANELRPGGWRNDKREQPQIAAFGNI